MRFAAAFAMPFASFVSFDEHAFDEEVAAIEGLRVLLAVRRARPAATCWPDDLLLVLPVPAADDDLRHLLGRAQLHLEPLQGVAGEHSISPSDGGGPTHELLAVDADAIARARSDFAQHGEVGDVRLEHVAAARRGAVAGHAVFLRDGAHDLARVGVDVAARLRLQRQAVQPLESPHDEAGRVVAHEARLHRHHLAVEDLLQLADVPELHVNRRAGHELVAVDERQVTDASRPIIAMISAKMEDENAMT